MKQEYMTNESGISAYRFRTTIVYFTILVICIILMITALFSQGKLSARMLFIICAELDAVQVPVPAYTILAVPEVGAANVIFSVKVKVLLFIAAVRFPVDNDLNV
jgi:hypothetical protein